MWFSPINLGLGLELTPLQIVLLAALFGLALGYFAARGGRRPTPANGAADKDRVVGNAAFMRGINYILQDRTDKAIEELTRAVTVDTETVETYIALGNLFRRTGEIDRAIRIRQSIILRPQLDPVVRRQAKLDLGIDYRRAGFYGRAAAVFEELAAEDAKAVEPLRHLVQIHEELKEWDKAGAFSEKLAKRTGRRDLAALAHYQVEIGQVHWDKGFPSHAQAAFQKALKYNPICVEAFLRLGDLKHREGKLKKAVALWRRAAEVAPDRAYLVFGRLGRVAAQLRDPAGIEEFLIQMAELPGHPFGCQARLALARIHLMTGRPDKARDQLEKALAMDPGCLEAHQELGRLSLTEGSDQDVRAVFNRLLEAVSERESVFQCRQCGLEIHHHTWRCPQCGAWETTGLKQTRTAPPAPLAEPSAPAPTAPPAPNPNGSGTPSG